LAKLDQKFKHRFADYFPSDIPHVHDLLRDIYHHIEVKPEIPISTAQAYSCPRKYQEGWKTLIDQHYAAGCIRIIHPSTKSLSIFYMTLYSLSISEEKLVDRIFCIILHEM
jgi:hypothetical protein